MGKFIRISIVLSLWSCSSETVQLADFSAGSVTQSSEENIVAGDESEAPSSPNSSNSPNPSSSGPSPSSPNIYFAPTPDEDCTIFVNQRHPNRTDRNSPRSLNTNDRPYAEIAGANLNHIGGDVVCIFPGEYREPVVPISGPSNSDRTVFKGVGNRSEILILGSQEVTGWQRCDENANPRCPVTNNQIYRAIFQADLQCRGGTPRVMVNNTNCIIDRQRGLIRATDDPFYDDYDAITDLNANEEFYYDQNLQRLFVYMNSDPSTHKIECTKGRNIVDTTAPLRNFTIQNLSIMQSNYKAIAFGGTINSYNILIRNNEIAFTHGEGYCSENPAAIYSGAEGYMPLIQNIQIVGNTVHDVGSDRGPWNDVRIRSTTHAGCAIETYSITNSLIEGNVIYRSFQSIGMKAGNAGYVIRNNVIHDTDEGIWIGTTGPRTMTEPVFGADVVGNLIYNLSTARSSGMGIYNTYGKIFYNVYGNTLYNTRGIRMVIEPDPTHPVSDTFPTLRNNIVSTLLSTSHNFIGAFWNVLPNLDSDYNMFFDTKLITNFAVSDTNASSGDGQTVYHTLDNWKDLTPNDSHSTYQDPRFVNMGAGDFRIQATSPARNAGEYIEGLHCERADDNTMNPMNPDANCRHWCESRPDLGAFEYCPNAP